MYEVSTGKCGATVAQTSHTAQPGAPYETGGSLVSPRVLNCMAGDPALFSRLPVARVALSGSAAVWRVIARLLHFPVVGNANTSGETMTRSPYPEVPVFVRTKDIARLEFVMLE